MSDFDLLIRGGTLVDGNGTPGVRGDLGIRDGRIAGIGKLAGTAERTLDAAGCVVSPGFVDIHTHYDAQIFWDRRLTISPWHGVTTVVMGNCGFGIAPTREAHRELILKTLENVEGMSFDALVAGLGSDWGFESFPEYLDAVDRTEKAINVAALIGHTPLRLYVMGEEATEREATADEIEQMHAIVDQGLRAGAIGFATSKSPTHVGFGGRPVPSRAASLEEIQTLAGTLGELGQGVMQATIGRGFFLKEFAEIARKTGRPISWTALLAAGDGRHRDQIEQSAELQRQGLQVVPQVACRPLVFEFQWKAPFIFESMSVFQPVSAADHEGRKRVYADPEWRERFKAGRGLAQRWDQVEIASCEPHPELCDRKVADVAAERGVHPIDLALDLGLETNLEARFRLPVLNTDEEGIAELLGSPAAMLGLSDAGAHASQLCDACYSTHLLSHWVRDKGVLSMERAVQMLTSRTADVFGITDRGRLQPGLAADVAVFDPDSVGCSPLRRVNDLPAGEDRLVSDAIGMRAVVVNGTLIREDGVDTETPSSAPLPGRLLRGGPGGTQ